MRLINTIALTGTIVLTGLLLAAGAAGAQTAADRYADPFLEPVFHPLPENVQLLRLENGLEVVFMRNPGQPMVGVYTQVKVGSAWEDFATSGMSHMLEHLLFNGSEKYTQEELYAAADRAGAYNNANTTDFYTNYMMVLPAANLETGLDLQSQMLFHSLIPTEKFPKEQGIVTGEIVQGRDRPGHFAETTLRQALFAGSSLELPTVGTKSTIDHMTRDDVYAFYKHWYVPNNMIVTVAGNFDPDQALELLETYYGDVAPGTLDRAGLRSAAFIDRTRAVVRRGGDQRLLALSFEAPGYDATDFFPYLVLTELLNLDGTGILSRALADLPDDQRPQLDLWWEKAPGFGRLTLQFDLPPAADPEMCYRLVQDALVAAMDLGVSAEDIGGIVSMSETNTLLEREQLRMTGIYISEPLVLGGTDLFVGWLDRLREVTAESVVQAAANWLLDAPCLAVLIEPDTAAAGAVDQGGMPGMPAGMKMPEGMQMPPAMKAALEKQQAGATPKDKPAGGPAAAPAPLPVDRSVLTNGAVLVSQTDEGSPLMAIHLAVRNRAELDAELAAAGAVDLVHRLLDEGHAGCDRACLAARLRSLGAVVKTVDDPRFPMDNYYTTGRFSFIRIECAAENGPALLELLTEMLRFAAFDSGDFARVRDERIGDLERESVSARGRANALLDEALCGEHPLSLPPEGSAASLAEIDFNQLRNVYRRAFAPENLIFSVIGPQPHDELRDRLQSLLPGEAQPTAATGPLPVTREPAVVTDHVGGELAAVRLGSIMDVPAADRAALGLLTAILSDRLMMDLRETRGLSYSAGASLDFDAGRGRFTAWLNPPVERKDEGVAALREFLASFDATTVTAEEVDTIRAARAGRQMMRHLSSLGRAYYLAMAELDGDIAAYLNDLTRYDGLTAADLQAVAHHLRDMALVEVVVD